MNHTTDTASEERGGGAAEANRCLGAEEKADPAAAGATALALRGASPVDHGASGTDVETDEEKQEAEEEAAGISPAAAADDDVAAPACTALLAAADYVDTTAAGMSAGFAGDVEGQDEEALYIKPAQDLVEKQNM